MGAIEALALEPYRDGRTIPVLIEVLHQSAGVTRASAAAALAQFGPRAAAAEEALHTALRDSSDAVRHEAQHALRSIEGGKRH